MYHAALRLCHLPYLSHRVAHQKKGCWECASELAGFANSGWRRGGDETVETGKVMRDFRGEPMADKVLTWDQDKKGEAREVLGKLRNDEDQQAKGQVDQAGGKGKSGFADAKDKLEDAVDDIKK